MSPSPCIEAFFFRDDVGTCFLNMAFSLGGRGPSGGVHPQIPIIWGVTVFKKKHRSLYPKVGSWTCAMGTPLCDMGSDCPGFFFRWKWGFEGRKNATWTLKSDGLEEKIPCKYEDF